MEPKLNQIISVITYQALAVAARATAEAHGFSYTRCMITACTRAPAKAAGAAATAIYNRMGMRAVCRPYGAHAAWARSRRLAHTVACRAQQSGPTPCRGVGSDDAAT